MKIFYIVNEDYCTEEALMKDWGIDTTNTYSEACVQLSKTLVRYERADKLFKITIEEIPWTEDYSWVNEKEILDECGKRLK